MDSERPPNTCTADEAVEMVLRSWKRASTELLEEYPKELVKNLQFELEEVSYQLERQGLKNFESKSKILESHLAMAENLKKYFEDVIESADSDLETDNLKVVFYVDERDPYQYRQGLFKIGSLKNWISSQEGMRSIIPSPPKLEDYAPQKAALPRLADISFATERKLERGQQYFLLLSLLLETHLDAKHPQWREISADETDKTSTGYFLNGRIRPSRIAASLDKMLETSVITSGKSAKDSLKRRIEPALTYLYSPDIETPNVKHQQERFILQTIYLVAQKILAYMLPENGQCDRLDGYSADGFQKLLTLIPEGFPISTSEANTILNAARDKAIEIQEYKPQAS